MSENISLANTVLGITDPNNARQSLAHAHLALTGEQIDWQHRAYLAPLEELDVDDFVFATNQTSRELIYDAVSLCELLARSGDHNYSSLTDWPNYEDIWTANAPIELDRLLAEGSAPGRRALLIGAQSPLSSLSFVKLAQELYGASEAIIVDPVTGRYKPRHGLFVQANGLELPLAPESVQVAQTNHLLRFLQHRGWMERAGIAVPSDPFEKYEVGLKRLASQITRVLSPGGQLLMVESSPWYDPQAQAGQTLAETDMVRHHLEHVLEQSGLVDVVTAPLPYYEASQCVFEPRRDYVPSEYVNAAGFSVYARKREA